MSLCRKKILPPLISLAAPIASIQLPHTLLPSSNGTIIIRQSHKSGVSPGLVRGFHTKLAPAYGNAQLGLLTLSLTLSDYVAAALADLGVSIRIFGVLFG